MAVPSDKVSVKEYDKINIRILKSNKIQHLKLLLIGALDTIIKCTDKSINKIPSSTVYKRLKVLYCMELLIYSREHYQCKENINTL